MSFVTPTLNIDVKWWTQNDWWSSWPVHVSTDYSEMQAQLRASPRTSHGLQGQPHLPLAQLIVPPGWGFFPPVFDTNEWWYWMDVWEVPSGSGHYYHASDYYTVATGFMNQYTAVDLIATWWLQGAVYNGLAHWPFAPPWNPVTTP